MQFLIKLLISITIIIFCSQIGRKAPTLAGLIATMPLTGLLVLLWLYSENLGNFDLMKTYTKGALWGIIPSILFFLAAYFSFHKRFPIWLVLTLSFAVWLIAAAVHQILLKD